MLLVSLAALPRPAAGQAAAPVSRAEFNQWMQDISNWGRWGPEDELGTLNLITDEPGRRPPGSWKTASRCRWPWT